METEFETIHNVYNVLNMSLAALDASSFLADKNLPYLKNNRKQQHSVSNNGVWTAELLTVMSSYLLEEMDGNI